MEAVTDRTVLSIWHRTVPLLIAGLFFSYLDRVNLGFAAVTMNRDLNLSNTAFGLAAGAFAIGYALFGIPSTLLSERYGARRWLALTLGAWGLFSAATAYVRNAHALIIVRALLGVAEAGFSPALVVYCNRWFPSDVRARVFGSIFIIVPLSQLVGGTLSGFLLNLDGTWGLRGWQWLFLTEAAPTVLLALLVHAYLPDTPADAQRPTPTERQSVPMQLPADALPGGSQGNWQDAFRDIRVWRLAVIAVGLATSGIATLIFLPLIVHSTGFSASASNVIAALPGAAAAVLLPVWGMWADRTQRHSQAVTLAIALIALGLFGCAALLPSRLSLIPLSIALTAFFGSLAPFWTLPARFLSGPAAAAGTAFINVCGNLGQFVGPLLLGRLADRGGGYGLGLMMLGGLALCASLLMGWRSLWLQRAQPR